MLWPPKHMRNFRHRLFFHCGRGAAAVKCMIVGIDPLRKRVRKTRDRMGRLEHLPGIERMEVGIVILKFFGSHAENSGNFSEISGWGSKRRQIRKALVESFDCFQQNLEAVFFEHRRFRTIRGLCRAVLRSAATPVALAGAGKSRPNSSSTSHFHRVALFPRREDLLIPHQIAIEEWLRSAVPIVIPGARLPCEHPFAAPSATFAGHPRSTDCAFPPN